MTLSLTPLSTTSELAAVNRLLSAIGEAPISDLTNSTREDVALAVTLLKEASMEVQSLGWKFNREFGYELSPAGTLAWVGTDGTAETLNVFTKPTGLISFRISSNTAQGRLDVALRLSRTFQVAAENVVVFYDRSKNRDGFLQDSHEYLYIDPTWAVEWADMPETARRYITLRAARQFIQQTLGAQDVVGYGAEDEFRSLYALQRDQGDDEEVSMLDSLDVASIRGGRPNRRTGYYDNRASAGPA